MKYTLGKEFIVGDMSDRFIEVTFDYDTYKWDGVLPLKGKYQGYEISVEDLEINIEQYYNSLHPDTATEWKTEARKKFLKAPDTIQVFDALCTGKWECRKCGPVPKVNSQPPARIRDIKKKGFFIATRRQVCKQCNKNAHHDILIMTDINPEILKPEFRKPISQKLSKKIVSLLKRTECVFEKTKTQSELVIDHKFPSQRWDKPESDNNDNMLENEIKNKFQLLDNQTNLLKSRECDRCIFENKRGVFMGIKWYYKGNEEWAGSSFSDEKGCIGCPWYDVKKWKEELLKKINS